MSRPKGGRNALLVNEERPRPDDVDTPGTKASQPYRWTHSHLASLYSMHRREQHVAMHRRDKPLIERINNCLSYLRERLKRRTPRITEG